MKGGWSTLKVVVDTSFVLPLALAEARSLKARMKWSQWVSAGTEILAPTLLAYEVPASLRNKVHRDLLKQDEARMALDLLFALPINLVRPTDLHRQAYDAAEELLLPTAYDCHFLVLAELLQAELWTLDEKFQGKAVGRYANTHTIAAEAPKST